MWFLNRRNKKTAHQFLAWLLLLDAGLLMVTSNSPPTPDSWELRVDIISSVPTRGNDSELCNWSGLERIPDSGNCSTLLYSVDAVSCTENVSIPSHQPKAASRFRPAVLLILDDHGFH